MLSTRNLERVREQLDTFLANVRPSTLYRDHFDVSYLLNEFSWVVNVHFQAGETSLLTAHPRFKAVHSEEPEGWSLYLPDEEGQWVSCTDLSFVDSMEAALELLQLMINQLGSKLIPQPKSE